MYNTHFSQTQLFWGQNLSLTIYNNGLCVLGSSTPSGASFDSGDSSSSSSSKQEPRQLTFTDRLPYARGHGEHRSCLNSFNLPHNQPMRKWYLPIYWGGCGGTEINLPETTQLATSRARIYVATNWFQRPCSRLCGITSSSICVQLLHTYFFGNYILPYWYVHYYTSDIQKQWKGWERQITCQTILPHTLPSCTPHFEGHGLTQAIARHHADGLAWR